MPNDLPRMEVARYEPADAVIQGATKLLVCLAFSVLLWLSASVLAALLNDAVEGPPGNLRIEHPFWERWYFSVPSVGTTFLLFGGPVFLLFGGWVAFYPPRQRRQWRVFVLALLGVGALGGWFFQWLGVWDFEDVDEGTSFSPPLVTTAVYAMLLGWVTALSATAFCFRIMRRWLHPPSPNQAQGRVETLRRML